MQSLSSSGVVLAGSGAHYATARRFHIVAFMLTLSLAGCWDDGPVPEVEIPEVLIGSTEPGSGQLVTEYDFSEPVAVDFASDLMDFKIYSGTVPGFVNFGLGRETAPFGLADGLPVSIRITAIDPGVSMVFGEMLLAQVGDSALIGETPMDVHPQWQLVLPADTEPIPGFVSFVLEAPGYTESAELTASLVVAGEEEEEHEEE